MATSSEKDARRRRIVDRGSDRLALITGRIQTLPSPSSPELYHSHTASCPPSLTEHQHLPPDLSDQSDSVLFEGENAGSSALLQRRDSNAEPGHGQFNDYDGGSKVQPVMRKCESSIEASRPSAFELNEVKPFPVSSPVQDQPISISNTTPQFKAQIHHLLKFLSPNQISPAIAASKTIRIQCSLVAAILVVLSYIGFPIIGSQVIRSIVLFRPLYLLLLTNISIVARIVLGGVAEGAGPEGSSVPPTDGHEWTDQVGLALELGFVTKDIFAAFFMDCSVYAIVVVCGLSLAHNLWFVIMVACGLFAARRLGLTNMFVSNP